MKIDFKLSPVAREKARKILRLRKEGLTFDQIAQLLHHHRTYIFALKKAGLEQGVKENIVLSSNEDNPYEGVDTENKGVPTLNESVNEKEF